jgi:hypothetical protein
VRVTNLFYNISISLSISLSHFYLLDILVTETRLDLYNILSQITNIYYGGI